MPKSEYLSRSLEMKPIWTFDSEFPTIFSKACTYITFKSAVKHRQQVISNKNVHIVKFVILNLNGVPADIVH